MRQTGCILNDFRKFDSEGTGELLHPTAFSISFEIRIHTKRPRGFLRNDGGDFL